MKIKNFFKWLFSFDPTFHSPDTKIPCKHSDVETAVIMSFEEALKAACENKSNWDYIGRMNDFYKRNYAINIDGIMYELSSNNIAFHKRACMDCETCIGWFLVSEDGDYRVGEPTPYLKNYIDKMIKSEHKKNLEKRRLEEEKIARKKLAKEICKED